MSTEFPAWKPEERLRRLGRLALKELREILRDRRTIVTLVLMPLLMYPLLSIVFQQFFMSQLGTVRTPRYTLGFESDEEGRFLVRLLAEGGLHVVDIGKEPPDLERRNPTTPIVEAGVDPDVVTGIENFQIDVALRVVGGVPRRFPEPARDLAVDLELLFRNDSVKSRDAAAWVEQHVRKAGQAFLAERLERLNVSQRAVPVGVTRRSIAESDEGSTTVSITAVIPFILILMTVTGAVYPAIDLTAGERERGTLEVLVAAPIPRMGVLLAKYAAVLTVALLTAAANLITLTITISAGGMAGLLFGENGVNFGVVSAVFGLLLLFAAFFSAVLLAITSSARSFKEAQAYLIPLMLAALAPGILSLMPGLELSGLLLVTPLANIVLLGRDLLRLSASGSAALIVVASTLVYAGAAIALAARIFGAETVLYSSQSGWSDLFRRPRTAQPAPTLTSALLCLALMFPLYFALLNLIRPKWGATEKLVAGIGLTAIVFGVLPVVACWVRRVAVKGLLRAPSRPIVAMTGALLIGVALWTIDHETVVMIKGWHGIELRPEMMEQLRDFLGQLRTVPLPLLLLSFAVVPAFFEETFFRGYLFSALLTTRSAFVAIVVTSAAFGLFHWIAPNPMAAERVVSSTLTGLVLGWVRWRTGSVWPGMLLHMCHNGLLILLTYFEPQLSARGFLVTETKHLPIEWLVAGGLVVASGLVLVTAFFREERPSETPETAT